MNTTPQAIIRFLVGVAITALVCFLVWYFSSVVVYVLISAVLAIMCRPLVSTLTKIQIRKRPLPRWMAAVVALLTIWLVFGLLCMLFIPLIADKVMLLSKLDYAAVLNGVEEPIRQIQNLLQKLSILQEGMSLRELLVAALSSVVDLSTINSAFSSVLGFLGSLVITFFSVSFITFFFMKEDDLFFSMIRALFPDRYQENVTHAMNSVTHLLSRYFAGLLAESCVLMVTITLVMMAFGMKAQDAGFIGLIMGVMNVIPYAGPLIGGIMSVFMGIVSPIEGMSVGHTAAVIICSILTIKGIDDFIIQPTIYSDRVNAHPLEIFIVILLAGSLAGIWGMLLAIPSYTVLRVFAKEFFSQVSLVRKLTQQI